jgi:thiamine-monophosphate kinase
MIDLSDGLAADVGHLSAASGVHCALELASVPRHAGVASGREAAASGEEYELLVALPPAFAGAAAFEAAFGLPLTRVGSVAPGLGVTVTENGTPVDVSGTFRHF